MNCQTSSEILVTLILRFSMPLILKARPRVIIFALSLFSLAPVSPGAQPRQTPPEQQGAVSVSTPEQLKEEFASVPCKDAERLGAVKALFEKMGAPASDVSVEKYKTVENLVVRKTGSSQETVVFGAHYDKVSNGCGAVDNWTGVVALAHLYRSLKDAPLKKTVLFVAFGKEEKGLVGSGAMVGAVRKEQRGQFCAMVNLDSFGQSMPQALDNASSKKLTSLAAELARESGIPFSHAAIRGADSDSSSFLRKKIPAITLHGMSDGFRSVIHTANDKASKVNAESLHLGYRLALALAARLDESPCDAYR